MVVGQRSSLQRAAATKLWRALAKGTPGVSLSWKLDIDDDGHPVPGNPQALLDKEFKAKPRGQRTVILASRGWGKTFLSLTWLLEAAISRANTHYAFVTLSKVQAKGNIRQSVETILEDCPDDVRPVFLKNDARFEFQNGSTVTLLGVDADRFETIRGRAFHGVVVDESQSIDRLDHIVKVILNPCIMRVKGWMVMTGTIPESPEHDFLKFVDQADAKDALITKTILECPRYTGEQIEQAKEDSGGEESDTWQREYLVKRVFTSSRRVIPEWTPDRAKNLVRDVWPPPPYRDRYVGLDFAFSRDLTVALFGYLDFANNALVIEDELALKPSTTAVMAAELQRKEEELWGQFGTVPVDRWADGNEARTIHELRSLHRLMFRPTDKKGKQMSINAVRMLISEGRLVVSPKCKLLIRTLMGATWDKNHKQFDRSEEIGHADALDALLYMSRNVQWKKNPVPMAAHWTEANRPVPPKPASSAVQALRTAFGGADKSLRAEVNRRLGMRRKL